MSEADVTVVLSIRAVDAVEALSLAVDRLATVMAKQLALAEVALSDHEHARQSGNKDPMSPEVHSVGPRQ